MLTTSLLLSALAATGLAQATIPNGYRAVYMTSMQDTKFVIVPKARTAGSTTVVQTATKKADQVWWLQAGNSSIQLADTTLCMDAGAKTNWKDMGTISIQTCDATSAAQQWNVLADGRIALTASSPQECIDLQYLRATQNNPVGLYACAGLQNSGAKDKGINWPLVNVTAKA